MSEKKTGSCLFLFIGFIIGISAIAGALITIFIVVISFSSSEIAVKNKSWLVLDFSGKITEKPLTKMPGIFTPPGTEIELIEYINAIKNASTDQKIEGIIINGDLTFYSRAHTEEIGKSLEEFKKAGKKVVAWFSNGINSNYNICIYADEIYMPDTDSAYLTLKGYSMALPYYKDAFDKIGLEFNAVHIGDYKGTGENYTKNSMSDELKNSYLSFLENYYAQYIDIISTKRNINKEDLINFIESGRNIFMSPNTAIKEGLIDGKLSYNQLTEKLSNKNYNSISLINYSSNNKNKIRLNKIAIIYAEGTITNYYSGNSYFQGDFVGSKSLINDIQKIKKDNSIKAVILRVNSPGGSALGSELILQELIELQKEKPVYVSFSSVAASGGYYISCMADKIYTLKSTMTGSIGVVSILMNYEKLTDNIGINYEVIKKHKYDDFLSNYRKPTDEEIEILKKSMKNIYQEFTNHVVTYRKIKKEDINKIAEGRIWTGTQAIKNKLADEIGGLQDALNYAAQESNIGEYSIDSYPKPQSFLQKLSNMNKMKIDTIIDNKDLKKALLLYYYCKDNNNKPSLLLPLYELF